MLYRKDLVLQRKAQIRQKKDSRTWNDKAKKYCLEEHEKGYHRAKAKVEEVNKEYRELGLKEVSLIDFFEYNKDYQERARKELEALESKKRAERLLLLIEEHNKSEIESKYKELKTKFENINAERRKTNQPLCDVKEFFGYKPEFLELALKDYPPVLLQVSKPVEVELEKLPAELFEFIYIHYYLTGEKSLPKLNCIYDTWAKSIYADSELNEEQWQKIIEKMSFNPTKCKQIDALYHFTHKDNLESILLTGLITRKKLKEQDIDYKYNDEYRWDALEDSISLSISHPNYRMFYKYRCLTSLND